MEYLTYAICGLHYEKFFEVSHRFANKQLGADGEYYS